MTKYKRRIQIKTFSLVYDPREDRMKLLLNKNGDAPVQFWITRRFYFSLLFELETYMEQLHIPYADVGKHTQKKKKAVHETISKHNAIVLGGLLENVHIRPIKEERKKFKFLFQSKRVEAESLLDIEMFLKFYAMLKKSFPKREWGML